MKLLRASLESWYFLNLNCSSVQKRILWWRTIAEIHKRFIAIFYSDSDIEGTSLANLFTTSTKKTAHGTSDKSENTSPIVPAVDGMIIKIPAIRPNQAVVLLNTWLRSITQAMISSAAVLSTKYISKIVPR